MGVLHAHALQAVVQFVLLQGVAFPGLLLDVGGPGDVLGQREDLPGPRRHVDVDAGDEDDPLPPVGRLLDDGSKGAVELHLGVDLGRGEGRVAAGDDPRHGPDQVAVDVVARLGDALAAAPEMEEVGVKVVGDRGPLQRPALADPRGEVRRGPKGLGGAEQAYRLAVAVLLVGQPGEVEEEPFIALLAQQLVVYDHQPFVAVAVELDVPGGEGVLVVVPGEDVADGAAVRGVFVPLGLQPPVDAELARLGLVTHVARLDDHRVPAVVGVGGVAVGRDDAADPAVVEGEGTEVLGDQDDRVALVLVRAEGPRRHDQVGLHAEGEAEVEQPRHEVAVPHGVVVHAEAVLQVHGHGVGSSRRGRAPKVLQACEGGQKRVGPFPARKEPQPGTLGPASRMDSPASSANFSKFSANMAARRAARAS